MKSKMKNKESYYMNIPATVWDTDLSAKAILCYGHVTVLANKNGFCYANNRYFERILKVSTSTLSRYLNELESLGLIRREVTYKPDSKEVYQRRIYMNIPVTTNEQTPIQKRKDPIITDEQDNTTSNNTTSNNTRKYNKIYDMLIDKYPKNRIQSKNPVIKLLKNLDKEDIKLILKNKDRYLKASNGYTKNLRRYIEEECWSEAWLKAEEETKQTKNSITDNTKTFKTNY